jgi:lysophospholipase L1-like esterase
VVLGDLQEASETIIKAESRRLMSEAITTRSGEFVTYEFIVNVRTPVISAFENIRITKKEIGFLNWDDKLTIEFNGKRPCVTSMTIEWVPKNIITVFLTGDSTVTDQDYEPWNSWGQMLTCFFNTNIAVANYAHSGETMPNFKAIKRLSKVESLIKEGDYLFIQFGHNDMKLENSGAYTTYKRDLESFIYMAQSKGAIPVLVSSVHRRTFLKDGTLRNSLDDYPDAVRQTAKEQGVALIDLNAMSKTLYESWGMEESKKAFVDGSHHNNYGSYEVARCVVEGIISAGLPLARDIKKDYKSFDPAQPDPIERFTIPQSSRFDAARPAGN